MYKTDCPKCGHDVLRVSGKAEFSDVVLEQDGFETPDAENTYAELVYCSQCDFAAPLCSMDTELIDEFLCDSCQAEECGSCKHAGATGGKKPAPASLYCKNPFCLGEFSSADAQYSDDLDTYLCPRCGGTDVKEIRHES